MRGIRHLPNMLTLANLLCGCLGIAYINPQFPHLPAYFVWAAVMFDFLDGYVARLAGATSSLGKQLDSLADMVSFGVLPSIAVFSWLKNISPNNEWIPYSGLIVALCTALRLAKFNLNEDQKNRFIGLPSPANALFITGLAFLPDPFDAWLFNSNILLPVIIVLFSVLMIAPICLFAIKFKNFSWEKNKMQFTFTALSLALLGFGQAVAISPIIFLYITFSLLWAKKLNHQKSK